MQACPQIGPKGRLLKILPLIMLLAGFLGAASFTFKESRYVKVVNLTIQKEGNVTFDADATYITYEKSSFQKALVQGETLTLFDKKNERKIDLGGDPYYRQQFALLKAVAENSTDRLEQDFIIEKKNGTLRLRPKSGSLIHYVTLERAKRQLTIFMRNGDTITYVKNQP